MERPCVIATRWFLGILLLCVLAALAQAGDVVRYAGDGQTWDGVTWTSGHVFESTDGFNSHVAISPDDGAVVFTSSFGDAALDFRKHNGVGELVTRYRFTGFPGDGVHTFTSTSAPEGWPDSITVAVNADLPAANDAPTVSLPADDEIFDTDEDGSEDVWITANGSDTDGTIASYAWYLDGVLLPGEDGSSLITSLAVGVHVVLVEVTDDGGATGDDSMQITISAPDDTLPPEAVDRPLLLLPGDRDPAHGGDVPCGDMVLFFNAQHPAWATGQRTGRLDVGRGDGFGMSWVSHSEIIMDANAQQLTAGAAVQNGLLGDGVLNHLGAGAAAGAALNAILGDIANQPGGGPPDAAAVDANLDIFGVPGCVDHDGDGVPEATDTDGDGVADIVDSDIDGDGVPNSEDEDADNDGYSNSFDDAPFGGFSGGSGSSSDSNGNGVPDLLESVSGSIDTDGDGVGDTTLSDEALQAPTSDWEPDVQADALDIEGADDLGTADYTWQFQIPIPGVSSGASTFALGALPDTSTAEGQALDDLRLLIRGFMTVTVVLFWAGVTYKVVAVY